MISCREKIRLAVGLFVAVGAGSLSAIRGQISGVRCQQKASIPQMQRRGRILQIEITLIGNRSRRTEPPALVKLRLWWQNVPDT